MTVLWFTGLSGAGKTTVATAVRDRLAARGVGAELLDGDELRGRFPAGFSKEERASHIARVAGMAAALERRGIVALVALISPYREARRKARAACRDFIEVFVSAPLEVCELRDVKGLYAKARRGEIADFTGIGDPYEPPESPELTLDTAALSVEDAAASVIRYLEKRGLVA